MGQQQSIILDHIYNISATCNNLRIPIKFIQLNALFVQLTQLNTTHRNSRNLSDVVIPVLFYQPFGRTHDSSTTNITSERMCITFSLSVKILGSESNWKM